MPQDTAGDDPAATSERETRRNLVRGMIQLENELRNQRLGWLLALNGFLFAGLGFVWNGRDREPFLLLLAVAGGLVSLSCWFALDVNTHAIAYLREVAESDEPVEVPVMARTAWRHEHPRPNTPPGPNASPSESENEPPGNKRRVSLVEWRDPIVRFLYPWNFVPVVLGSVWLAVAIIALRS